MKHRLCVILYSPGLASFFSRMKISLILVCLFAAILTAGCAPVVYRVNPDSPPKMGEREARDAVELALSLIMPRRGIEGIHLGRDELVVRQHDGLKYAVVTVSYGDVTPLIWKPGNYFQLMVTFSGTPLISLVNTPSMNRFPIYWKSEEDARLFLDGIYALRQWKIAREKGMPAVASAPSPPLKKVVPPEEPARKEKHKQVESTIIAIAPPQITPESAKLVKEEAEAKAKQKAESEASAKAEAEAKARAQIDARLAAEAKQKAAEEVPKIISTVPALAQVKPASVISKPPKVVADKTPPKIIITEPDITRAVSVIAKKMDTLVTGVVESKSGVMYILVNNQDADLAEKGNFSAVIPLKVGKNTVTVIAVDTNKNKSTKEFVVNREAGKVVVAKKEEDKMKAELSNSKYYALLIAVQDYDSAEIGKLDFPVSDAQRLGDILSSQYTFNRENITTLVNPDRRTIYKTLQSIRKELTEKDNLLIFYAGHGYWVEDMKQGFWLPKDASGINDFSDWIPNSTVRDYIKAIKAKHILLVADSCFSGGIFKMREVISKQKASVEKIYELPSRRAMTSGAMKTVPDQSVFLKYLVKKLKDNNEPYLDAQKLFASLREVVIDNSPSHQTPLYGAISEAGDEGGDFIFVKR